MTGTGSNLDGVDHGDDPHCPECGEPIGQTATYCMHCSADLTDERAAADTDQDGAWESSASGPETATASTDDGALLAPDGFVDDTLTAVVGIVGGLVVGLVGTFQLLILTESAVVLPVGLVTWLGATAYLVRRRTVQEAVSKAAYALAVVFLAMPLLAASPAVDGGLAERGGLFVVLLLFAVVPAAIAAAVGWVAARFVPEGAAGSVG